jgi:Transposase and inactivated derivatives
MKRKQYSKEFKLQAIMLILKENQPIRFVSKQLDVHENTMYRWVQEYEDYGEQAFPGKGSREFVTQTELKRLEKENKKLKEEVEALKKFQVFLKKNRE